MKKYNEAFCWIGLLALMLITVILAGCAPDECCGAEPTIIDQMIQENLVRDTPVQLYNVWHPGYVSYRTGNVGIFRPRWRSYPTYYYGGQYRRATIQTYVPAWQMGYPVR